MKFLLVEILIWLVAASVLGLVIGWMLKAVFARRRIAKVTADWEDQFSLLQSTSRNEISSLEETATVLEGENATLQSKVGSISAMVKSMETALMKANAENKALGTTVSSQQLTINEIRVESENLIKKQSAMQMELNALEKSKDQELASLNRQLSDNQGNTSSTAPTKKTDDGESAQLDDSSGASSTSAVVSRLAPILNSASQVDTGDIDQKIKSLNEQRDRLNREREELFNQEQHFAAQLTRGDDTEAYLDQTIRIDEDLTSTIQSDTSELHRAAAQPADSLALSRENHRAETSAVDLMRQGEKPKSLWDKFKSSVNRPVDKPKA